MLEGIRILDLTRMLAGPYATMLLADLGAEVWKIESPEGDEIRRIGPPFVGGESAYFLAVNRNKKGVVLDLKTPEGKEAFLRLVANSDILVENFRPGVLERLGLDDATLLLKNPSLILCSITSFGRKGAMAERPAFDLVIQALGGAMRTTGETGRPPVRLGIPLGDLAGGLHAAIAILGALVERGRTFRGRRLDVSLLDSLVSMQTYLAQYYLTGGEPPGPQGSRHLSSVPYGAFECEDGEWFVVGVFTDRFWPGFCRAIGKPDWAKDPKYATNEKRVSNRAALEAAIDRIFRSKAREAWIERFLQEGVPAAPVLGIDGSLDLEPIREGGLVRTFEHARAGIVKTIAAPVLVDGERLPLAPSPGLGEHTAEALRRLGGFTDSEVAALRAAGALGPA